MKYIAIIGEAKSEKSLINAYCRYIAKTKWQLKVMLKKHYENIFWQEKPDAIGVYEYIVESNGYIHTGPELFRVSAKRFWAKK